MFGKRKPSLVSVWTLSTKKDDARSFAFRLLCRHSPTGGPAIKGVGIGVGSSVVNGGNLGEGWLGAFAGVVASSLL